MADSRQHRILSLCSGVGMLDEGLRLGLEHLGRPARVVGYCERDSYAASVLLARMEDASLGPAPVWCGNLEDLDAESLRGHVDWIVAGFPCQPWSAAGKQQGTGDERWLWPAIARIIRHTEPAVGVFLENVPGLVSGGGLHHVLDDLAEGGWDAEWLHLTAASVGASHKRERVFILAYRNVGDPRSEQRSRDAGTTSKPNRDGTDDGVSRAAGSDVADAGRLGGSGRGIVRNVAGTSGAVEGNGEQRERLRNAPSDGIDALAVPALGRQRIVREPSERDGQPDGGVQATLDDAASPRHPQAERGTDERATGQRGWERLPGDGCGTVANTGGTGQQERRSLGRNDGAERQAAERDCLPIFAPGPSANWSAIPQHLWPATEPGFRLLVDGLALALDASRTDQLRCGGNGVVAICAATAFVELVRRAELT